MKLYHYVHCPFCVRIRMVLGLKNFKYESIVLPYDDEKTPVDLMGVKMLPIMEFDDTKMNESLDIIQRLDSDDSLKFDQFTSSKEAIESLLSEIGSNVHSLCMPYWIYTKEFDENSRSYFQTKKEKKRGPFNELIQNREKFLSGLETTLENLEKELSPFYQSSEMTINDILIASHLWGMYIFPEFQFSEKVHGYLQSVKKACAFDYHQDLWLEN